MPKASALFNEMTKRVKKLKGKYMARQIRNELLNPLTYTHDPLNMAAYRLLVHAELEEYIETKALEVLKKIRSDVQLSGFGTKYLQNLLAISKQVETPLAINLPYNEADFKNVVESIIKNAEGKISKNNGIRKDSFIKMALFSGYEPAAIDNVLLNSVDSYGKRRGAVAHKGPRHITNFSSPSAEVNDAESIISMLRLHYYGF
ncbi:MULTISPECIES: HEPN domain-containing protein [Pectobacterium]|uniref:HEPN domain-containing protein n=1 Tax=Pectobacterium TaxID=122277 RepID=UPI001CC9C46A|nr:HEPN domain-containing protein [Pectobacterium versatile]MCA6926738.1 hypothetical protein [Pectobacterium versatile]MCH5083486.1 hypothetical protein [Pectobacterium versatile]